MYYSYFCKNVILPKLKPFRGILSRNLEISKNWQKLRFFLWSPVTDFTEILIFFEI